MTLAKPVCWPKRHNTRWTVLVLASALFVAPAHALDSATIVVGDGDTISKLFLQAKVPQRQLMSIFHSSKLATQKLDRVRPGMILSLSKAGDGTLQRLQITARSGVHTTFTRVLDPQTSSQTWQINDGALVPKIAAEPAPSLVATPTQSKSVLASASAALSLSESVQTAESLIAQARARIAAANSTPPADVVTSHYSSTASHGAAALAHHSELDNIPAKMQPEQAPSDAEKPAVSNAKLSASERLASSVVHAERLVQTARMITVATARTPVNFALRGMPAKVFDAEQRVEQARAREWLVNFGPANSRSVLRVADRRARSTRNERGRVHKVLASAKDLIGSPYLWGGTTPSGFDCSGFVVYNLNRVGVQVPRTAHQQFNHTRTRPVSRKNLRPGDLVFFYDPENRSRIGHVGIYVGNDQFIHSVKTGIPVKITSMNRAYYRKRFVRGGRVIT